VKALAHLGQHKADNVVSVVLRMENEAVGELALLIGNPQDQVIGESLDNVEDGGVLREPVGQRIVAFHNLVQLIRDLQYK
jgi:hypothetical protein